MNTNDIEIHVHWPWRANIDIFFENTRKAVYCKTMCAVSQTQILILKPHFPKYYVNDHWALLATEAFIPEVFCEKGVLENFAKFTGKHLCQSLFFNKVAGLRLAILLKKRLWHRCLPLNFCKVSKNTLIEHLRKTASKCCRRFLFKEFSKVTPRALERNLGTWSMFL